MPINTTIFGSLPDGRVITKFELSNMNGISAEIINYGGILVALNLPDQHNKVNNVCLGFDSLDGYLSTHPYFGCIVGRVANRISKAAFKLKDTTYSLAQNHGQHHLHGGQEGFDKKVWNAEPFESEDVSGVTLKYKSEDGEEGYPGELDVTVVYSLNDEDELTINYKAETDEATPLNLTNHAYWNFTGAGSGKIYDHMLQLFADKYLEVDDDLIPTGRILNVNGTPLDFRTTKKIGRDIEAAGGYDHCFVLESSDEDDLVKAARVLDPGTGRGMEVWTSKPGVQFYTGNFLDGIKGAGGAVYTQHDAFCLETQYFPDAVNKPQFPSIILEPGDIYHHITVHRFFTNS
mgnify:CR=1 FL=1